MVLCHGGPGGYDYLAPVANTVSDLCEVVRYDQRGSGRSQPIGPYDVATFVNDLETLRKHFNFERWIVGGHSWGTCPFPARHLRSASDPFHRNPRSAPIAQQICSDS